MRTKTIIIALASAVSMQMNAQETKTKNKVIDLGQVVYRMPVTAEFELINEENKSLRISQVRSSCGCTTVDFPQTNIAAGQTYKVGATYDAKQMGHFEKQVGLYFEDDQSPIMLTLKGVVVDEVHDFGGQYNYKMGDLSVDKIDIEFDDVNRGDRPFQEIHLKNNSDKPLTPVIMHLPPYLKADMSPSTIAPGRSGVARITLDSEQLNSFGLLQTNVYLGNNPGDKVSQEKEISVSTIILPNFEEMSATELANAPKLELSEEEIELVFGKKKRMSGVITLTNTGASTLEVNSLQMFTTGLKVSLSNTRLAPGEEAKMKITADKKELKTTRQRPRILMITNDPKNPKRIIKVKVK